VSTSTMAGLGVWSKDKLVLVSNAFSYVQNEFGGKEYLNTNATAIGSYGSNQLFMHTMTNIPEGACADLVAGLDAMAIPGGLWVDPAGVDTDPGTANGSGTLVKLAGASSVSRPTLSTACKSTSSNSIVTITIAAPRL